MGTSIGAELNEIESQTKAKTTTSDQVESQSDAIAAEPVVSRGISASALLAGGSRGVDRLSDWLNPILVKESRQALSSRLFMITFMTILLLCWLISVIGSVLAGERVEFLPMAPLFFVIYVCVLFIALFIVVPYNAFWSLLSERQEATFDVLNITTLSARRIVYGKLSNAFVQILIYLTVVSPFVAFTSLLQGFRLFNVSLILFCGIFASIALSCVGVMFSTLAKNRVFQAFVSVGFIGALFIAAGSLAFAFGGPDGHVLMSAATVPIVEQGTVREVCIGVGVFVLFMLLYSWIAVEVAVSRITFDSDNRSTMVRISCMVLLLAAFTTILAFAWYVPFFAQAEAMVGLAVTLAIHIAVFVFFVSCEPINFSRRIHNRIPKNNLLKLLVAPFFPFMPGAGRGFFYALLLVGMFILFCALQDAAIDRARSLWGTGSYYDYRPTVCLEVGLACSAFIIIYAAIALCLNSIFRRYHGYHSGHIRFLSLVVFGALAIVPFFVYYAFAEKNYDVLNYNWSMLLNPFATLNEVILPTGDSFTTMEIIGFLIIFTVLALVIALKPILSSIFEFFQTPVPSRLEEIDQRLNEQEKKESNVVVASAESS